jgi:hypothetical protein
MDDVPESVMNSCERKSSTSAGRWSMSSTAPKQLIPGAATAAPGWRPLGEVRLDLDASRLGGVGQGAVVELVLVSIAF